MSRCLVVLFLCLVGMVCWAHDPKLSGIGVATDGQKTTVVVQVHVNKLTVGDLASQITRRVAMAINGEKFMPANPTVTVLENEDVVRWRASYAGSVHAIAVSQCLFPEDTGSRTVVSLSRDGNEIHQVILDASRKSMEFGPDKRPSAWTAIAQFFILGVTHIVEGIDHILFILGLILLGGGLKALLKTITAFTIAHSITLSIAALGVWSPPSRFGEPIIALSIVAVALENLRRRPEGSRDWRPLVAFGFGLVHGFGFAGGVAEAGLPQGAVAWALASFNVGVEVAQALVVLVAAPLLSSLARWKPKVSYRLVVAGSLAIALAGAFWFVERIATA